MRRLCALALGSTVLLAPPAVLSSWAAPPGSSPAPPSMPRSSGPSLGPPGAHARAADLVLRGGAVYTMDAARSWAESIAIRKDTIVYAGPDSGIAPYVGPRTRVVNLG